MILRLPSLTVIGADRAEIQAAKFQYNGPVKGYEATCTVQDRETQDTEDVKVDMLPPGCLGKNQIPAHLIAFVLEGANGQVQFSAIRYDNLCSRACSESFCPHRDDLYPVLGEQLMGFLSRVLIKTHPYEPTQQE